MVRRSGGVRPRIASFSADDHREAVWDIARSAPEAFGPEDLRLLEMGIRGDAGDHFLWVALSDEGSVLGFVGLGRPQDSPVSWVVTWLGVAQAARRKGVATLLLGHVEQEARRRQLHQLFLETCSCPETAPSRRLYERRGFSVVGVLPDYYDQGHAKAIYRKQLSPIADVHLRAGAR